MKNNDKELISFNISDAIKDKTIGELINLKNSEVHYKNGEISIKNRIDGYITSITLHSYETSRKVSKFSSMSAKDRKLEYLDDIRQMLENGMKQKDIAYELGISEAYVTQLKKRL